jgi:hypothetical protein
MKILLGHFNARVGRENIFKPTIGNESLYRDSNYNGVRIVNFATSKNLVVKKMMFPHQNIRKYTCTYPDGQTDNKIDHILIDRRWNSNMLDVRSSRGADSDTDHYLVVAKVGESQRNEDKLNNVRCEASRKKKKKKWEYLKAKSDELETNGKIKNIRSLYRGINDLRRLPP